MWLQSFHPWYGPDYWPATFSEGETDEDVVENSLQIMGDFHPQLMWIYLADVDHEGHSGNWNAYTNSIKIADSLVNEVWNFIETDEFYQDNTAMLVTNDHGRHTNDFSGHGCDCEGCRHIMFLAIGENIKQNYISTQTRYISDFAVTAADILNINMPFSSGNSTEEIFEVVDLEEQKVNKNISLSNNILNFDLSEKQLVKINIFDVSGRLIRNITTEEFEAGFHEIEISLNKTGIFIINIQAETFNKSVKTVF